jgi:hypothetical protein
MASHVERVIDFLERCAGNADMPKMLVEDIQWAIEIISQNKLYTSNLNYINLDTQRPEIKAWTELISLKWIPTNVEDMERLKEYEELHKLEN